jgi:hypothetical protein
MPFATRGCPVWYAGSMRRFPAPSSHFALIFVCVMRMSSGWARFTRPDLSGVRMELEIAGLPSGRYLLTVR